MASIVKYRKIAFTVKYGNMTSIGKNGKIAFTVKYGNMPSKVKHVYILGD